MLATTTPAVIGPAASVIEVDAVRDAMAGHFVVWLTGPVERLAADATGKSHRPLVDDGDPLELFTRQMAIREPLVLPDRRPGDRRLRDVQGRAGRRHRRPPSDG